MGMGKRTDLMPVYGDPETRTEKPCTYCGKTKNLAEFTKSRGTPDGRTYNCRKCRAARKRDERYGLGRGDFDRMLVEQAGVCKICKKECASGQRLSVDHNHSTGEVRALLCRKCNSGLASFRESTRLLQIAVLYLTAYGSDSNRWRALYE